MTTQPYVELLAGDLNLADLSRVDSRALGSAQELMESGLMSHRLLVINQAKSDLAKLPRVNGSVLLSLVDASTQLVGRRLNSTLGPAVAETYRRVFGSQGAGDVPTATIYGLADGHVARITNYFNDTSREALLQAFNTYANKGLPEKLAADKALNAYGLTPRQVSGYTSMDPEIKVASAITRSNKNQVNEYVNRSLRQRLRRFSEQEAHNLEEQAKQSAWLYLQQTGGLTEVAEKVWLTARDEMTCETCAPMHGKRLPITERFELPNGYKVWVAGIHPNCRCEVRVVDLGSAFSKNLTPDEEQEREQARDLKTGRFGVQDRTRQDHAMATAPPQIQEAPKQYTAEQLAEEERVRRKYQVQEIKQRGRLKKIKTQAQVKREAAAAELANRLAQVRERTVYRPEAMGVTLRRPDSLPQLQAPMEQLPQLQAPMARLQMPAEAQPSISELLELSKEPEVDQSHLRDLLGALATPGKPKEKMVRPADGNKPYYKLVVGNLSDDSGQFQFSGEQFLPLRAAAALSAERKRRELMQEAVNKATGYGQHPVVIPFHDPHLNGELNAVLTPDDIKEAVKRIAKGSVEGLRASDWEKQTIPAHLYDDLDAEEIEEKWPEIGDVGMEHNALSSGAIPLTAIARELNLTPDQFRVQLLEITEVHDERGGRGAAQHFTQTRSSDENLQISGKYFVTKDDDYEPLGDAAFGVDVVRLAPFDPAYGVPDDNHNE